MSSSAQTITVSDEISINDDQSYDVIGKVSDHILLFRDKNHDYEITTFDERLQQVKTKSIELDKKNGSVIGVLATKNEVDLIYTYRNKGHSFLKLHKYNSGVNLTDSITIKDLGSHYFTPPLHLIHSEDKRKVLIYYIEKGNILKTLVYNLETLEIITEKSIILEGLEYEDFLREVLLSNSGSYFLVLEKANESSQKESHRFEILEFSPAGLETPYTIKMGEHLTYHASFVMDNVNNHLVGAGLYADNNRARARGYFYLNVNPALNDKYDIHFTAFDDDFVSTLSSKKISDNKGISDLSIQEIVLRKDGGILMIGEQVKEIEHQTYSTGRGFLGRDGNNYIVDYYYDNLFAISIHPSGETHWKTILFKKQFSQDDDAVYSSYFLFKTAGNLRFLFNDEVRNETTVSEYTVKGNGETDRNSLFSTEDQELRLRFRNGVQIGANEMVIPSETRTRLKLVLIKY